MQRNIILRMNANDGGAFKRRKKKVNLEMEAQKWIF